MVEDAFNDSVKDPVSKYFPPVVRLAWKFFV
jgi:hypothetical protein